MVRLLILVGSFSGTKGDKMINGLTKLAKLDFLLRYPVYLERSLEEKEIDIKKLEIEDYERENIESSMIRYKYGPWDFRYRKLLNILVGKGLVFVKIENKTINIGITKKGIQLFNDLEKVEIFRNVFHRSKILKQNFNISGTNLKKFIYKTFPEITTLRMGEVIEYEY